MRAGGGVRGSGDVSGGGSAPGQPNIARVYDYLLGGKDHVAADRLLASRIAEAQPLVVSGARANRAFLRRAVRSLAEQGVAQFLDVGCGLPAGDNVHQVAGRVNPEVRCVYVDNDPNVLAYARALLADSARTVAVDGDLREPEAILAHPQVRARLDFTRPIAVIMAAVLHFVGEEQDPAGIVGAFADALAPGSALVVSHVVDDGGPVGAATRAAAAVNAGAAVPFVLRSRAQVAAWFDGFRLVPPGLVDADAWRRVGTGRTTAPIVAGVADVGVRTGKPDGGGDTVPGTGAAPSG
ncbi:MAG: SAM-dependent methyltransferase [Kineosporiaceae bacterium]